ncbi:MAG: hypothetical protein NZ551_00495 [Microscillaceae bacterium]|nr:hypothetical protein [Microscillaceae bacterium]MDW8459668.1 hypothetical protein [Cytophagales bacterium]
MESLTELVKIITQKRMKRIELFDEASRNKASNYFKLFDGIHSGKYRKDEDAAKDLYACKPHEKKYLILKTRLKQKLMNMLFFIDIEHIRDMPAYKKVLLECNRAIYSAKTLYLNNAFKSAIPILEKTVKMAQDYGLSQVELEAANMLKSYYFKKKCYKEYEHFKALACEAEDRLICEHKAEKYYQETIMVYQRVAANKPIAQKMATTYLEELANYLEKYPTNHKIRTFYYKFQIFYYQSSNNYPRLLEVLTEREEHVKNTPALFSKKKLEEIQLEKINTYFHLNKPQEVEQYIQEKVHITAGTHNWFYMQEYRYLIAMHTSNYVFAAQIFQQTLKDANFRLLPASQKERWQVFQLYLHYIYKSQKIKCIREYIQNAKIKYKLSSYILQIPNFSKERRGINLAILLVQILFHLEKFNTEAIGKCIEEMEKYSRKYPKIDANYRSECFTIMLAQMKKENYRFFQTRRATEKLYQELQKTPMEYHGGNKALEILPYTNLWDMILEKLKHFRYG